PAPHSIVHYGGTDYYLGQDGFYAFDGGASAPIGAGRIDRWFFENADLSALNRVVGVADPLNKLIWWAFPGQQNQNSNPNFLLCYHTGLDRWAVSEITCETLVRLLS